MNKVAFRVTNCVLVNPCFPVSHVIVRDCDSWFRDWGLTCTDAQLVSSLLMWDCERLFTSDGALDSVLWDVRPSRNPYRLVKNCVIDAHCYSRPSLYIKITSFPLGFLYIPHVLECFETWEERGEIRCPFLHFAFLINFICRYSEEYFLYSCLSYFQGRSPKKI